MPTAHAGDTFNHRAGAGIGQMCKPEIDRVTARKIGQFIHEAFYGEHIRKCTQRAESRQAKGKSRNELVGYVLRKVVDCDRILGASVVGRQIHLLTKGPTSIRRGGREQVHVAIPARPLDMGPRPRHQTPFRHATV
jgi:hypothetical protein